MTPYREGRLARSISASSRWPRRSGELHRYPVTCRNQPVRIVRVIAHDRSSAPGVAAEGYGQAPSLLGHSGDQRIVLLGKSGSYIIGSGFGGRRVMEHFLCSVMPAKGEWLCRRVSLIVIDLRGGPARRGVPQPTRNGGALDQRREVDRVSCRSFAANAVRLQLHALAHNLGNFMRTLGDLGGSGALVPCSATIRMRERIQIAALQSLLSLPREAHQDRRQGGQPTTIRVLCDIVMPRTLPRPGRSCQPDVAR
jgi:hypothetical protein